MTQVSERVSINCVLSYEALYILSHYSLTKPYEVGTIIVPILQMRKLRPREVSKVTLQ